MRCRGRNVHRKGAKTQRVRGRPDGRSSPSEFVCARSSCVAIQPLWNARKKPSEGEARFRGQSRYLGVFAPLRFKFFPRSAPPPEGRVLTNFPLGTPVSGDERSYDNVGKPWKMGLGCLRASGADFFDPVFSPDGRGARLSRFCGPSTSRSARRGPRRRRCRRHWPAGSRPAPAPGALRCSGRR